MPCEVVLLRVDFFKMGAVAMETANMLKIEKHKNDHSRLLAKQQLMKRDKPKQAELVEQTLPQLPWKQKRGDLSIFWIPFIKLHQTL